MAAQAMSSGTARSSAKGFVSFLLVPLAAATVTISVLAYVGAGDIPDAFLLLPAGLALVSTLLALWLWREAKLRSIVLEERAERFAFQAMEFGFANTTRFEDRVTSAIATAQAVYNVVRRG